jgi:hypothetical protein
VRVQTSTGWQDVGGGGAGTVTDIDSPGNSVIITNPGGPVVSIDVNPDAFVSTDFDLYPLDTTPQLVDRMVTNDFVGVPIWQLKYITIGTLPVAGQANGFLAATKVTGITESSGPTALTIGTISDGQTLVRSGATVIGATVAASVPSSPYWQPPGTANAFNDEFASGSADLATRGWGIINSASGVVQTRAGDIQGWSAASGTGFAAFPTGNTYRSTIINGSLHIQVPQGTVIWIYRVLPAASGAAGTVFMRGWLTLSLNPPGTASIYPGLYALMGNDNGAGRPGSSYAYSGAATSSGMDNVSIQVGTNLTSITTNSLWQNTSTDGYFVRHSGSGNYYAGVVNANGTMFNYTRNNGGNPAFWLGPAANTMGWFQIQMSNTGFTRAPAMAVIDFIRYIPGDTWLAY